MLQKLEEKREAEQRYIEQKYNILSRQHDPKMTWTPTTMGPSSVQLSARQILPADLPTFNGIPDEWPTFISAFENSTSAAGFSNVENMLRLQKCLKEKAYDLVRDKLLLPTMVPEVISTLKTHSTYPGECHRDLC